MIGFLCYTCYKVSRKYICKYDREFLLYSYLCNKHWSIYNCFDMLEPTTLTQTIEKWFHWWTFQLTNWNFIKKKYIFLNVKQIWHLSINIFSSFYTLLLDFSWICRDTSSWGFIWKTFATYWILISTKSLQQRQNTQYFYFFTCDKQNSEIL